MSKQRRAEILLLAITIVWGSTFVIAKPLVRDNSPLFYTGIRFLFASLIVFVPFARRLCSLPRSTLSKGTMLGLLLFVGFALQTIGLRYTTASKNAFFTGTMVVLVPIIHSITQRYLHLERKPIRYGNALGVAFAASGLYLLTSPAGGTFNIGDALTLGCALMFAFYIVYLDFASSEPDKLQLTFVQFVVCGTLGIIFAFLFEEIRIACTVEYAASFLYLTVFATVIAIWVQNGYQGYTTPTRAAIIFAMEPVVAGVLAYFIRNENIGTLGIGGGVLVLAGLLVSELCDELPFLNRTVGRVRTDRH